jgi:hypothetical protein
MNGGIKSGECPPMISDRLKIQDNAIVLDLNQENDINEAGPGGGKRHYNIKPGFTAELTSLSQNKIRWSENKKHYIGQGSDGLYHFYAPNNRTRKSQFRKIGSNGQNTIGEYIVDPKSTKPFIGIKIVFQNNVETRPNQLFV